jgi:UDP-N-acetylmuramoyl-L-alanyl-D-glutamate--2,6-diaminopimelate ligase
MKLRDLLRDVPVRRVSGDLDREIASVTADSRLVTQGAMFVAIQGFQTDGARFIDQAVEKGAAAICAGSFGADEKGSRGHATIEVEDPRAALALIAANFHGRPADKLSLVGVTGPSGKTTSRPG